MKKLLPIFILVAFFIPTMTMAAGLVPCGGVGEPSCSFDQMIILVKNIIDFLIFYLAMPLAAVLFAYAGFLLLTSGGSTEKVTKAKHIFWNVLLGFVLALCAWLIVMTILKALGVEDAYSLLSD